MSHLPEDPGGGTLSFRQGNGSRAREKSKSAERNGARWDFAEKIGGSPCQVAREYLAVEDGVFRLQSLDEMSWVDALAKPGNAPAEPPMDRRAGVSAEANGELQQHHLELGGRAVLGINDLKKSRPTA